MRICSLISLFFNILAFHGFAQQAPMSLGVGRPLGGKLAPPSQVNASDGVYSNFVLIRWDASENAVRYRVFRATSPAGASLKELTTSWQNSTWFCDYSAEKGRDYYYAVMASDGKENSVLSPFDKGFVRKDNKIAIDETFGAVEQERYAAPKVVFAFVEEVHAQKSTFYVGDSAQIYIRLRNVFDEATPPTEVRVYLSEDSIWQFSDPLLIVKNYSSLPANTEVERLEKCYLPASLLPGEYHLIIVASPRGDILNAKTGYLKILIADR